MSTKQSYSSANVSRYYYYRLNETQKNIYSTISKGIKAFQPKIEVHCRSVNELFMIFHSVLLDNPLLFYISSSSSSHRYYSDAYNQTMTFMPHYMYDNSCATQHTGRIKRYLKVFDLVKLKSDLEKEKYVHDYCLDTFTYDDSFREDSYSVLGLVLNKTGVCSGISKFVKLALEYIGVDCTVVTGIAKNPREASLSDTRHMWNIVTINGERFHLDVTFNMTGGIKRYDYFNLSDTEIKKDHTITTPVPPCVISGQDYYTVNSQVVNSPTELRNYISSKLKLGNKTIVVKLKRVPKNVDIANKVSTIAAEQYIKLFNKSTQVNCTYNQHQMVFEMHFA